VFKSGTATRGDVERWLAEKHTEAISAQQRTQRRTLIWAMIAGGAAIVSVIIGIATLYFTIWPKH
jgi:type VI protein secretion system component VasF